MTPLESLLEANPPETHLQIRAFSAGWSAFFVKYGGLLVAHGMTDFTGGFVESWNLYYEKSKIS